MNYYLVALMVYSLLIASVSVEWYACGGEGLRYLLRIRVSGVPVFAQWLLVRVEDGRLLIRQRHILSKDEQRPPHAKPGRKGVLGLLLHPPVRKALLGAFHVDMLRFTLDISSPDAATTALGYSAVNLIWQTALRICPSARVSGRVSADFRGAHTRFSVMGIVHIRLGRMLLVAVALAKAKLGAWKGKQAYAAPD